MRARRALCHSQPVGNLFCVVSLTVAGKWISDFAQTAVGAVQLFVAVIAALTASDWVRTSWRGGPGERRSLLRRVEALSVGITRERFEEVLAVGSPTHLTKSAGGPASVSRLFRTEWCWIQMITDESDVVQRFAVCSRHRRFRPTFQLGGQLPRRCVTLHKTSLDQLGSPSAIFAFRGAQTASYFEEHYYGRPGHYRYYQAGFTEADMFSVADLHPDCLELLTDYPHDAVLPSAIRSFRHSNAPSCYGESLAMISADEMGFGPTLVESWAVRDRPARPTRAMQRAEQGYRRSRGAD
jgi:hypothetical protein